jgi:hypothetical protein
MNQKIKIDGKWLNLSELSTSQIKQAIEVRCRVYTQQSEKLRLYPAHNYHRNVLEKAMDTTQSNIEVLYSELNKRLPKSKLGACKV